MSRLTPEDLTVLAFYAENKNRELYWNYLASRPGGDGYGLLALGVVRNDNVPGAVANAFADAEAKRAGVHFSERRWNEFGVDLMERDLEARQDQMRGGRADLALNLPAGEVMRVHDEAFRDARIPVNAWTRASTCRRRANRAKRTPGRPPRRSSARPPAMPRWSAAGR